MATRLFEVSWEVCNKVGGINTVLESKAPSMIEQYGKERYTLIGPYVPDKAAADFVEKQPPAWFVPVCMRMRERGIVCHYGAWSIHDEPEAILLDFGALAKEKNDWRGRYWEWFKIDSLRAQWEFDEPMLFSTAAGLFIREYEVQSKETAIVAQFHEWMTGFGLLYLKHEGSKVATVFTTHATMLGRSIAGSGDDLYAILDKVEPESTARRLGVEEKHTAERASAQQADVFTTVSEITGMEAERLLGRKPDVLLFNGMSIEKFPTVEETSIKHATSREKLREFIAYYFFPYYSFDIERTLVYFITARYEHKNKGFDILIESLRRLDQQLRQENSNKTVVFFFWVPLATRGVQKELIENKNFYYHIKNHVDWHSQRILKQITYEFLRAGFDEQAERQAVVSLFSPEFVHEVKKGVQRFKRKGAPPISTHELMDYNIPLFRELERAGLTNTPENKVKVIIYPAYLDGADSMLNLPYYDAIVGAHLGVFPSYYEPWGYTPLEAAALAVPAITTDLAGFGRYIMQHQHKKQEGLFVLQRLNRSREEEIEGLLELLHTYTLLDHVERVENRLIAKNLSQMCDWRHFVKRYVEAHRLALERVGGK